MSNNASYETSVRVINKEHLPSAVGVSPKLLGRYLENGHFAYFCLHLSPPSGGQTFNTPLETWLTWHHTTDEWVNEAQHTREYMIAQGRCGSGRNKSVLHQQAQKHYNSLCVAIITRYGWGCGWGGGRTENFKLFLSRLLDCCILSMFNSPLVASLRIWLLLSIVDVGWSGCWYCRGGIQFGSELWWTAEVEIGESQSGEQLVVTFGHMGGRRNTKGVDRHESVFWSSRWHKAASWCELAGRGVVCGCDLCKSVVPRVRWCGGGELCVLQMV